MVPGTTLRRYNQLSDGKDTEPERQDLPAELTRTYREIVGALMYLVSCTRPDIAAAVNQLSQAMSRPLKEHMTSAKHVLKYLQGTSSIVLQYNKCSDNNLVGFTDASFGSTESRRSVTGYVFLLNGAAISWKTRVQPTVALSTAESEYMAACAATQEAIFLRNLLSDIGFTQTTTVLFEDNQPAIKIAENRITSQRSKHIDVKYHFIREAIIDGKIKLVYVPTCDQLADILTKILKPEPTARLRSQMFGISDVKAFGTLSL